MADKPFRITVHCSATPNGVIVPVANIRRHHIKNRGFSDIGYHFVIQPSGEVEKGRPLNEQGAHVEGANKGNIGVCLVGENKFSMQQFISLNTVLEEVCHKFSITEDSIYCHYQFDSAMKQGKTCPNIPAKVILNWYLTDDAAVIQPYLWEV